MYKKYILFKTSPHVFSIFFIHSKDAISFLEEAFQAGHSAYDSMCLHYCHNLWSSMRNKPYLDVVMNENAIKEVDKNKAYLHSLNVITSTFERHSKGLGPTDIFQVSQK